MKKGWYILLYHNVSWEENSYICGIGGTCPPDVFRDHLANLSEVGELISIQDGINRSLSNNINRPLFSFWFDDGLSGIRRYALPLLEKYNIAGALSISSRFWSREEFFWRFKLSYLSYIDGLRFLRVKLKKYGYKNGMSVKNFSMNNFSESIVEEIDAVFKTFTSEAERKDAFRLFETPEGILELKEKKWVLANHTAAHYPVAESSFINNFEKQFAECEHKYIELLGQESKFWVLPFDRAGFHTKDLIETFREYGNNRYLVRVCNRINNPSNIKEKFIFRIIVPTCSGRDLINLLAKRQ